MSQAKYHQEGSDVILQITAETPKGYTLATGDGTVVVTEAKEGTGIGQFTKESDAVFEKNFKAAIAAKAEEEAAAEAEREAKAKADADKEAAAAKKK